MARKEKVTKVIDGDTFETASRKNPVRLANVKAPEKGKAGAVKATVALRDLI
jgi:endonuclease YncB( thermonuclease family)